jgi:hypothetical protein
LHFGVGIGVLRLHFGRVRSGVFPRLRGRFRRGESESHPLAELFAYPALYQHSCHQPQSSHHSWQGGNPDK